MSAPDMSTDDFIKIDFSSAELSLNIQLLEAIRIAVHGQVQTLLEMYTRPVRFSVLVVTMLARVIGPLQNNVISVEELKNYGGLYS